MATAMDESDTSSCTSLNVDDMDVDEELLKFCSSCFENDSNKEVAVQFCPLCGDTLCKGCVKQHKRYKLTKSHTTIPIEEMTLVQFRASKVVIDDKCQTHTDKTAEMLCIDHQELCCPICPATTHKLCVDKFVDLEDAAKVYVSNRTKNDRTDFKDLIDEIQTIRHKKAATFLSWEANKDETKKKITKFAGDLRQKIDTLETQSHLELNNHNDEQNQRFQQHRLALEKLEELLNKESKIYEMLPHLKPRQVFISSRNMLDRIQKSYEASEKDLKAVDILLKFEEADLYKDFLNAATLGKIHQESSDNISDLSLFEEYFTSQRNALKIQHIPQEAGLNTTEPNSGKPINVMDAGVKLTRSISRDDLERKKAYFKCGAYLSDGNIVLGDYNNKILLILNDNYKFVKEYTRIRGQPLGICKVQQGDNDILYVVTGNNTVDVITYNTTTKDWGETSTLKIPLDVNGIATIGDKLITGHYKKVAIQLRTQAGLASQVEVTKGGCFETHITVSPQGDQFYYRDEHTVVCRGLDGSLLWKYDHDLLRYVAGMCTDPEGNVYVVGYKSCNIHQISADRTSNRILVNLSENVKYPSGIIFHPSKNMFILTSNDENGAIQEYSFC